MSMVNALRQVVQHTRGVTLGTISWKKFPDGFPNIFVHDVESIKVLASSMSLRPALMRLHLNRVVTLRSSAASATLGRFSSR
eukprot:749773-Hanusia_phi.AAC.11